MHKLLQRQLRRHFAGEVPAALRDFIDDVDTAYRQADEDRALLERSLDLTSNELLERNAMLRSFLDAAPFVIGVFDLDGDDLRFVNVNRATEALWHVAPEAAEGRRATDIGLPHEEARRYVAQCKEAQRRRQPVQSVHTHRDGGSVRWHVATIAAMHGSAVRFCVVIEDATERQHAQHALADSEATVRSFFEAAPFSISIVEQVADTDYRIISVNEAGARISGDSRERIIGRLTSEYGIVGPIAELASQHLRRCRETGQPEYLEFEFPSPAGARWLQCTVAALETRPGMAPRFCAIIDDATDRVQLQRKLALSSRMASVGTLAAGIAHEINNPLAYVVANLAMAIEDLTALRDRGAAGIVDVLGPLLEAQHGSERIRRIVRDLKTFSRADETTTAAAPVDVRPAIESAVALAANEIRHRARLVYDFQPIPLVDAVEFRLGQLFLNLLINAAQAIPAGAAESHRIGIATRTSETGMAIIEVSDTGCGIPEALREKVFDPFFTTKPVGEGTGLGLAICHSIVSDARGAISIASTVGRGTTFCVELPPSKSCRPALVPSVARAGGACRGRRVLVIDDEPSIGVAVRRILRQHDVVAMTRARDALALLERGERFDVVMCDLMMPDMTGIAFHREVSRFDPEVAARMFFISGGAFTPEAIGFVETVKDRVIEKPFPPQALHALVAATSSPAAR